MENFLDAFWEDVLGVIWYSIFYIGLLAIPTIWLGRRLTSLMDERRRGSWG